MKTQSFNILMAEDDPTIGLVVPIILRRLGHTVDLVNDGKEAIALFSARPEHYSILITDHGMPTVTGLELVRHLRKNGFEGKIIVMSGSLTDDLMHAYVAGRVNKILQKPFTVEMLSVAFTDMMEDWQTEKAGQP